MSEMQMSSPPMPSDINDNDKLMALLAYLITPIVPIVILVSDSMKARPYQKYHAQQALGLFGAEVVFSVVACIVYFVCSAVSLGILALCLWIIFFLPLIPQIYYAYIAYTQGRYFDIPIVTDFMKQQGWLQTPGSVPPAPPPPAPPPAPPSSPPMEPPASS